MKPGLHRRNFIPHSYPSSRCTVAFQSPVVFVAHAKPFSHLTHRKPATVRNAKAHRRPSVIRKTTPFAVLDNRSLPTGRSDAQDALLSENDLSQSLKELGDQMGSLPSGENFEAALDREARKERDTENAIFNAQLGFFGTSSDLWSPEQEAAYQLINSTESDSLPSSDLDEILPILQPDYDRVSLSGTRKSFAAVEGSPQRINIQNVGDKLKAVKRRRQKVALERGEDVIQVLKPTTSDLNIDDSMLSAPKNDAHANTTDVNALSLSFARIIDIREESRQSNGCALTAASGLLIREQTKTPSASRPFAGMQAAFLRTDSPSCPRCSRPMLSEDIESSQSVCSTCYSEIFIQDEPSSFGDASTINVEHRDEFLQLESKAVLKARAAAKALVQKNMIKSQSEDSAGDSSANAGTTSGVSVTPGSRRTGNGGASMGSMGGNGSAPSTDEFFSYGAGDWNVQASDRSLRTINPIRNLVQNIDMKPNPNKELIKLSVGDPTVYGNLKVSQKVLDKFSDVVLKCTATGYAMSMGIEEARAAVAKRYSIPSAPLTADDVIIASGTSGALETVLGSIANEGDNILVPSPGFPLFRTLAEGYGIECRHYRLDAENSWEIELGDLAMLRDSRTKAIVVNNPSNPCGSVYSAEHIEELLTVASALKLPIVADEVYADMTFSGHVFTSVASLSDDVPVLSVGSISKQCVVPGWRLGWVLVHDRNDLLRSGNVRKGMLQMTTRMLGANTPVQHVLPTMLEEGVEDVTFRNLMNELEVNAKFTVKSLASAKGLRVIEPQGSMYVMVEIDLEVLGFKDDMDFTEKLLAEESVFVLPGLCFNAPGFVRVVFSAPQEILSEAFYRIRSFCSRHGGGM